MSEFFQIRFGRSELRSMTQNCGPHGSDLCMNIHPSYLVSGGRTNHLKKCADIRNIRSTGNIYAEPHITDIAS